MDGLHGHGKAINRREVYIFTFHDVISSSLDSHVIATGSFDTCGPPPAWHTVLCLRKGSTRPIVAKWDGKNFGAVGRYWGWSDGGGHKCNAFPTGGSLYRTSLEGKIDISKHWNIVLSVNYIQYNHQFISMFSSAHENASKSRSLESRLLTGLLFLLLSWRFDSSICPRQSCFQVCCHLY